MRFSVLAVAASLALVSAAPDAGIVARGKLGRTSGNCTAYAPGTGPSVTKPDSAKNFVDCTLFSTNALDASTPSGYELVSGFQNLQASAEAGTYLAVNDAVSAYNPALCADECASISGCESFNIYYERDPVVNATIGDCPNPHSLTRIKCAYWGIPLTSTDATNFGQKQAHFHVVIAGSNAYNCAA